MKKTIAIASVGLFVLILMAGALIIIYDKINYPLKYEDEIMAAAQEFNVDKIIISSIIKAESRFNPDAISSKGAIGLMQVMPSTAGWVVKKLTQQSISESLMVAIDKTSIEQIMYDKATGRGELLEPITNIRIGTYYFSYLLKKFNNFETAICAYNAGEGTVSQWLKNKETSKDGIILNNIPYKETENYLKKIKKNIKIYSKKFK